MNLPPFYGKADIKKRKFNFLFTFPIDILGLRQYNNYILYT